MLCTKDQHKMKCIFSVPVLDNRRYRVYRCPKCGITVETSEQPYKAKP